MVSILSYCQHRHFQLQFFRIMYNISTFSTTASTQASRTRWKTMESYKMFESGWIQNIGSKSVSVGLLLNAHVIHLTFVYFQISMRYICCPLQVKHSQKLNLKPLHCWLVVDHNGIVLCAHCTCMAGLGEVCSHVGAALFALESWSRLHTDVDVSTYLTNF